MNTPEMAKMSEMTSGFEEMSLEHSLSTFVHSAARQLYEANAPELLTSLHATADAFTEYWNLTDSLEAVQVGEVEGDTAFASGVIQTLHAMSEEQPESGSETDNVTIFAQQIKGLLDTFDFSAVLHELATFRTRFQSEPDTAERRYLDGVRYAAQTVWRAQRARLVRDAEQTYNKPNPTTEENEAVCLAYIATNGVRIGQKITTLGTEIAALPDSLWLRGSILPDEASGKLKLTAQGVEEVKRVFATSTELPAEPESEPSEKSNRLAGAIGGAIAASGFFALTFVGETPDVIQNNPLLNMPLRTISAFVGGVMVYDVIANSLVQDVYRTLFPKTNEAQEPQVTNE